VAGTVLAQGNRRPGRRATLRASATYTPAEVAKAKALACSLPADHGVPLSRWSGVDLAAAMRADGIAVSPSTVRRWLTEDALKPWQHQSWIFRRDPEFEAKAAVVLDLY
jgi:hypothetical protein